MYNHAPYLKYTYISVDIRLVAINNASVEVFKHDVTREGTGCCLFTTCHGYACTDNGTSDDVGVIPHGGVVLEISVVERSTALELKPHKQKIINDAIFKY